MALLPSYGIRGLLLNHEIWRQTCAIQKVKCESYATGFNLFPDADENPYSQTSINTMVEDEMTSIPPSNKATSTQYGEREKRNRVWEMGRCRVGGVLEWMMKETQKSTKVFVGKCGVTNGTVW